ncbi:hypothetical protein [Roseococcus sp.]|uniref:hypothetical protein n=1 Tax=Roseococcus sp. TaxID=2109646 RepID=UPI003BA9D38E
MPTPGCRPCCSSHVFGPLRRAREARARLIPGIAASGMTTAPTVRKFRLGIHGGAGRTVGALLSGVMAAAVSVWMSDRSRDFHN